MPRCMNCEYFSPNDKHSEKEGFCDYHKDFFLPSGKCKHFKRIDQEQPDQEREKR